MYNEGELEISEHFPRFFWSRVKSYSIIPSAIVCTDTLIPDIYRNIPSLIRAPFVIADKSIDLNGIILSQEELFPPPGYKIEDKKNLPTIALAQSQGDIEGLLDFVHQFGLLTDGLRLRCKLSNSKSYIDYIGESTALWFEERWAIKNLLLLWEWIDNKDFEKLNKIINYDYKKKGYHVTLSDMQLLAEEKFSSEPLHTLLSSNQLKEEISLKNSIDKSKVILYYGFVYCNNPSNELLLNLAYITLERLLSEKLFLYPSYFTIEYNQQSKNFDQIFRPKTLISLIWYQFSHYVTKERRLKRCAGCGQWQDVTGRKESWKWHKNCGGIIRKRNSRPSTGRSRGRPRKEES